MEATGEKIGGGFRTASKFDWRISFNSFERAAETVWAAFNQNHSGHFSC